MKVNFDVSPLHKAVVEADPSSIFELSLLLRVLSHHAPAELSLTSSRAKSIANCLHSALYSARYFDYHFDDCSVDWAADDDLSPCVDDDDWVPCGDDDDDDWGSGYYE